METHRVEVKKTKKGVGGICLGRPMNHVGQKKRWRNVAENRRYWCRIVERPNLIEGYRAGEKRKITPHYHRCR